MVLYLRRPHHFILSFAVQLQSPPVSRATSQIPIHNNGEVPWTLNAGPRQSPFGGPSQLVVPACGMVSLLASWGKSMQNANNVLQALIARSW